MSIWSAPGSLTFAKIRQTVNGYFSGTGLVEAWTPSNDGAGGFVEAWTPVAGGTVPIRIDPVSYSQVETIALAEGLKVVYHVTAPYNTPIIVGNRIRVGGVVMSGGSVVPIGTPGTYTGGTAYNVRTMSPDVSNLAFVRCLVQEDVS